MILEQVALVETGGSQRGTRQINGLAIRIGRHWHIADNNGRDPRMLNNIDRLRIPGCGKLLRIKWSGSQCS